MDDAQATIALVTCGKKNSFCQCLMLDGRDSGIVLHLEEFGRSRGEAVLFLSVHHDSVVGGGAAEKISLRGVAGVSESTAVHEEAFACHIQQDAQFVIVGVAPLSANAVRHRGKPDLRTSIASGRYPGPRKDPHAVLILCRA